MLKTQFGQLCGGFGREPCTCYYPDHPDVTIFELSSDEITVNASKTNGSGPSNCTDLQAIGYSLKGFYVIRFNEKRIKTIYCDFNMMNKNMYTNLTIPIYSSNKENASFVYSKISQFCEGLGSPPCNALYSDYPDNPLFEFKKTNPNASLKVEIRKPTSCGDLNAIGYSLKGFYWVTMSEKKVQLVYCDFKKISKKNVIPKGLTSSNSCKPKTNISSRVLPYCNMVGSQPCSCYYSKFVNVLQFELSNDEVTRQAASENGAGPKSCDDLKNIGYTFDGFYMVRFKTNVIKTVYCMFNYNEDDEYDQEITTQSTMKPTSRVSFKLYHKF